ncbi:IS4 family transposase [Malikia sp.]|uniref:IS4 family transposase n=1 Tax=Malikia sp. TaxID=2070706 RepID=UPI0026028442|nr:IS4 family transposase [Malikia sp.]MDD2729138.1 IS4 family transposase [Malikia sp.]
MARVALEQALPAGWIDEVFEANRQRQYPRELMMSTVVELMMLVSLGLRPSLHAAARKMERLPVSLAALYDKVNRTEPAVLRALVQGSAARLAPVMAQLDGEASLAGWRLRILDGNHLPASQKRLSPLRDQRGAALPGHTLVVYDPDQALVTDIVACEDAHESERTVARTLVASARAGELWLADSHFCTRTLLQGWQQTGAAFIVREHGRHPSLVQQGSWHEAGRCETGVLAEQSIGIEGDGVPWRRIQLVLDEPTRDGLTQLNLWSNLPHEVTAQQIANLYRRRWRIEGLFGRLESVLNSEIRTLGHPRAALLGFATAVLAYNVLSLLKRCIEQAHREQAPELEVSTYHLAVDVVSDYKGMLIALPPSAWSSWSEASPEHMADYLLHLARFVSPRSVATSKRGPKKPKPKGYVEAAAVRKHVSTARVLRSAKGATP